MNILEGKLTSLETQLATETRMENDDNELEVVTHSGKIAIWKGVKEQTLEHYAKIKICEEASKES